MEHNVEPEAERNNEEGIPDQECDECLQYFVKHGHVNVVLRQLGVSAHQGDKGGPAQDDAEGGQMSLGLTRRLELLVRDEENDSSEDDGQDLHPVLQSENVSLQRDHHLEELPEQNQG